MSVEEWKDFQEQVWGMKGGEGDMAMQKAGEEEISPALTFTQLGEGIETADADAH